MYFFIEILLFFLYNKVNITQTAFISNWSITLKMKKLTVFVLLITSLGFIYSEDNQGLNKDYYDLYENSPYSYSGTLKPKVFLLHSWDSGRWILDRKKANKYNDMGLISEEKFFNKGEDNSWTPSGRFTEYEYNSEKLMGRKLERKLTSSYPFEIYSTFETEMFYDIDKNLVEKSTEKYNEAAGEWENYRRHVLEYDAENSIFMRTEQLWQGEVWMDNHRETFYYNESGALRERLVEYWDFFSGKWKYEYFYHYVYSEYGLLNGYTVDRWESGWLPYLAESYLYNRDMKISKEIKYLWSESDWTIAGLTDFNYDSGGNLLEILEHRLNFEGYLVNYERQLIFYDFVGIDSRDFSLYLELENYPNPFNPVTEISFRLSETADIDLCVYDVLGREVKSLYSGLISAGENRFRWSGDNSEGGEVSAGIYFYVLRVGSERFSKKMCLVK